MQLEDLIRTLRSIRWSWTRSDAERALSGIAGPPVEAVPGRTSFGLKNGVDVSLYYDGDRAGSVEVTLEVFEDPHLLSPEEYEAKIDEYFQKYEQNVARARQVLGPPAFDGGVSADAFPEDQDALWLALWPIPNARLMIEQKHEDKELPIRISVVVTPPTA